MAAVPYFVFARKTRSVTHRGNTTVIIENDCVEEEETEKSDDRSTRRTVKKVGSFHSVVCEGPIELIFKPGKAGDIKITGSQNVVKNVKVINRNGVLTLSYSRKDRYSRRNINRDDCDVKIYCSTPDLQGVTLKMSASFTTSKPLITRNDFSLDLSTASEFRAPVVKCDQFRATSMSASELKIDRVEANDFIIDLYSASEFKITTVLCDKNCDIRTNSASEFSAQTLSAPLCRLTCTSASETKIGTVTTSTAQISSQSSATVDITGMLNCSDNGFATVTASSTGTLTVNDLNADVVELTSTSSATSTLRSIQCKTFRSVVSTYASATLEGKASRALFTASTGGEIYATKFHAKKVTVEKNSSCKVKLDSD